jgi:hypothetical protein
MMLAVAFLSGGGRVFKSRKNGRHLFKIYFRSFPLYLLMVHLIFKAMVIVY